MESITKEFGEITKDPSGIAEIVFNIKNWKNEGEALNDYLRESKSCSWIKRKNVTITRVEEELQTYEGSGCAILNTLAHCARDKCLNSIALLAAGEGSRLWGASATNAFVKALTPLFRHTLLEQTIEQSVYLLSKAPQSDFTIVAGTDNIFIPSQPLATLNGTPFAESKGNLFFFSIEKKVLNERGELISEAILDSLEQLGIMIVDENASKPIEFIEKPPRQQILQVLQKYNKKSVFFNSFVFGFTRQGKAKMIELYSQKVPNAEENYFQRKDFDWSAHVLEPLSICSNPSLNTFEDKKNYWMARWNNEIFNEAEWLNLLLFANQFVNECGAPVVISLGSDPIWYDTGLCSDLYDLYQETVSDNTLVRKSLRSWLHLPEEGNIVATKHYGNFEAKENAFVFNSCFKNGGSVGNKSIVVNSTFEEETHIPDGWVIINSSIKSFSSLPNTSRALFYSYISLCNHVEVRYDNSVFFTTFLDQQEDANSLAAEVTMRRYAGGLFPLHVVPKYKGNENLFGHYNVNDNAGKPYLQQTILGLQKPLSFKDLQSNTIPSLRGYLTYLSLCQCRNFVFLN